MYSIGWVYRKLDCCAWGGCTGDGAFVHGLGVWERGLFVCYVASVASQQLWSWRDGQFTKPHFPGQA